MGTGQGEATASILQTIVPAMGMSQLEDGFGG